MNQEYNIRNCRDDRDRDLKAFFAVASAIDFEDLEGDLDEEQDLDHLAETLNVGTIDEDTFDEAQGEAQARLEVYELGEQFVTTFEVVLSVGGPTQWLSAKVQRNERGWWDRVGEITYHHSWGVDLNGDTQTEIPVWENSGLAQLFDNRLDIQGA